MNKVLIIEDDDNWYNIFQMIIGQATANLFEYVRVTDLKSALSYSEPIALILLDLMLPDSSGLNTLKAMLDKGLPIIIMTTLDDEKLMQEAFVLGVEDYLVKDKYSVGTFIHACRQSIRRFLGRQVNSINNTLEQTFIHLKSIETELESWESLQNS